jgi:hypothetical protein
MMRNIPPSFQRAREIRLEARHGELHVAPALVQKVPQRRARDDVCAPRPTVLDGCANRIDGAVALETLLQTGVSVLQLEGEAEIV